MLSRSKQKKALLNKNVFLTGATGGLGSIIADDLQAYGCRLYLVTSNKLKIPQLRKKYRRNLISASYLDLSKPQEVEKKLKKIKAKFKFDIIINCAGIFPVRSIDKTSLFTVQNCFNINVISPFIVIKQLSNNMKKTGWGRIINIGSSSSYNGFKDTSVYCSSKHALLGLSRSISDEFKPYNIRTYTISPGSIKTKMGKKVKNQTYENFIDPKDISELLINIIQYDNNMIVEEISLGRMIKS